MTYPWMIVGVALFAISVVVTRLGSQPLWVRVVLVLGQVLVILLVGLLPLAPGVNERWRGFAALCLVLMAVLQKPKAFTSRSAD